MHTKLDSTEGADQTAHGLCRVGDMFKFGRSTRTYILGGPAELMPEEGLTKKQAQEVKALEVRPCGSILLAACPCHGSHRAAPAMHHGALVLKPLHALIS